MRWVGGALVLALVASCSAASSGGHVLPSPTTTSPDKLRSVARQLAAADHRHRDGPYVTVMRQLHQRCRDGSPATLNRLATSGYRSITRPGTDGASYLSVLRSLRAGTAPNGPPASCGLILRRVVAEVAAPAGRPAHYGGYAATTAAWAAAHRADPAHAGGYLPRLANGHDSFVIGGAGRVTTLTRNFDPPLSQPLAISSIRQQLLPGGLHSVYTLPTGHCYEVVYLSPALATQLSSSTLGVMIELTSGHGISSHYDPSLVDRAILTVGGRIGGQPCV